MLIRLFRPTLLILGVALLVLTALMLWRREPVSQAMIVSSNFRDYDQALYLMTPEGVPLQRLTRIPGAEAVISASEDGAWIILRSLVNQRFYSVHASSGRLYPIWDNHFVQFASWSPHGDWLILRAFDASAGGNSWALYRMRPNGQGRQRLSTNVNVTMFMDWSPDGEWLYFVGVGTGEQEPYLYRVRADGDDQATFAASTQVFASGTWSADGTWLYYSARRNLQTDIYRLNVQTGEEQQLTDIEDKDFVIGWSPDGEWLYFRNDHHPSQTVNIYQMRPDGGDQRLLFAEQTIPDKVTVYQQRGHPDILVFEALKYASGASHRFNTRTFIAQEVPFQPQRQAVGFDVADEAWMIYLERATYPLQLRLLVVNLEDGRSRDITPPAIDTLFSAQLSPDGKRLYAETMSGGNRVLAIVDTTTGTLDVVHRTAFDNNFRPILAGWVNYGTELWDGWRLLGLSVLIFILALGSGWLTDVVRLRTKPVSPVR